MKEMMMIFPIVLKDLDQIIRIDPSNLTGNNLIEQFNEISSCLSSCLSTVCDSFLDQLDKVQEANKQAIAQIQQAIKKLPTNFQEEAKEDLSELLGNVQLIEALNSIYANFTGGLQNAIKTYIGFAKIAVKKLEENGSITSTQLMDLLKANRPLLSKIASLAMPLLLLFDNLNDVQIDSYECYEYNSDNFEISSESLKGMQIVPKQSFLEDFLAKAKDVKNTVVSKVCNHDPLELEESILFDYADKYKIKTHGCLALQDGTMNKFFDAMEAIITKVVSNENKYRQKQ